jgi:hypothetical protein
VLIRGILRQPVVARTLQLIMGQHDENTCNEKEHTDQQTVNVIAGVADLLSKDVDRRNSARTRAVISKVLMKNGMKNYVLHGFHGTATSESSRDTAITAEDIMKVGMSME